MKNQGRALLFFISFNTVLLELLQMKYLNVILNSTSAFLIITLALFMLSLSSATASFWQRRLSFTPLQLTAWPTALFCGLAATQLFSLRQIANSLTDYTVAQQWPLSFFVLILISLPYYFSGLALLSLLNTGWSTQGHFQKNYIFDMLGVLAAVFAPHFLIESLGPEKIMALALMPLTGFALLWPSWKIRTAMASALAFNFFILFCTDVAEPMDAMLLKYKQHILPSQLEYSHWDPAARIDVVDYSNSATDRANSPAEAKDVTKYLFYDGGTIGTNIYYFDGNYEELKKNYPQDPKKYFLRRASVAVHLLKENSGARVYLFGVGAGQELKAALMYGAQEVYANELVRSVLRISTELYSQQNGGIFNDPRVHLLPGDGRLQLERTAGRFDIIQIFSNYLSANMTSGLAPHMITYLFTEESMGDYMQRLSDDGLLQINQIGPHRILNLIKANWIKNRPFEELKKHIYVIQNTNADAMTTILYKKSEFTAEDDKRLQWLFKTTSRADENYVFVETPFNPLTQNSFFHAQNNTAQQQNSFSSIKYATDEKPFFTYNEQSVINNYGLNQLTYLGYISTLVLSAALYLMRRRQLLKQRLNLYLFYFASGLSFICIQYALAAKVSRFLNSPDLTYPLVLAAFAFSNILAVPLSQKNNLSLRTVSAMWGFGVISIFLMPLLLQHFALSSPDTVVVFVAFMMMTAISFLPALTFPVLSRWVRNENEFNLLWLANGAGLLMAGLAVHALTLAIGLTAVLLTGLTLYLVSFFLVRHEK